MRARVLRSRLVIRACGVGAAAAARLLRRVWVDASGRTVPNAQRHPGRILLDVDGELPAPVVGRLRECREKLPTRDKARDTGLHVCV